MNTFLFWFDYKVIGFLITIIESLSDFIYELILLSSPFITETTQLGSDHELE